MGGHGLEIIIGLGAILFYFVSHHFRKIKKSVLGAWILFPMIIVMNILTFKYFNFLIVLFSIGAWVGTVNGLFLDITHPIKGLNFYAKKDLEEAYRNDRTWDKHDILRIVGEVTPKLLLDISQKNIDSLKEYATDHIIQKLNILHRVLSNNKRSLEIKILEIANSDITDFKDNDDNSNDSLKTAINLKLEIITKDATFKSKKHSSIKTLQLNFKKINNKWMLDDFDFVSKYNDLTEEVLSYRTGLDNFYTFNNFESILVPADTMFKDLLYLDRNPAYNFYIENNDNQLAISFLNNQFGTSLYNFKESFASRIKNLIIIKQVITDLNFDHFAFTPEKYQNFEHNDKLKKKNIDHFVVMTSTKKSETYTDKMNLVNILKEFEENDFEISIELKQNNIFILSHKLPLLNKDAKKHDELLSKLVASICSK